MPVDDGYAVVVPGEVIRVQGGSASERQPPLSGSRREHGQWWGSCQRPQKTSYRSRRVVSITGPGMEGTVVVEMEIVPYLRFAAAAL